MRNFYVSVHTEAIKSAMSGLRCGGCINFILDFKSGLHTAQVLNHVIIMTLAQLVPLCRGTRHVMQGQSHARLCHYFLAVVRISADRKIADTMSVEFGDKMKSDDEPLPWWFVHTKLAA